MAKATQTDLPRRSAADSDSSCLDPGLDTRRTSWDQRERDSRDKTLERLIRHIGRLSFKRRSGRIKSQARVQ